MKKDIIPPVVKDVAVAIVWEENAEGNQELNVYLINLKKEKIEGVLVSSSGYGTIDGEPKKTAIMRHFLDELEPMSFKKIEGMDPNLLVLSNEFWVSFFLDKKMHDKKYIFLAESVTQANEVLVPVIGKKGVLIK